MSSSEPAEAAGSSGSQLPSSSLPWHQIPRFEPGVTDLRTYARKLEFLRDLWPAEHIQHLAPRAALQVEGIAFQRVARLKAEQLRSAEGVKYLVESLGGAWGRLDEEDRYDLFERAIYAVQQKPDETNDSYLSRHDVVFDDLLSRSVKMEEIRAYVLLRQSGLTAEDRKKVIIDAGGKLEYESAKRSIRLLGSRFFQDLQTGGRGTSSRLKTYDLNYAEEAEEVHHTWAAEPEMDEDAIHQLLLEEHDEDAHFVQDFEEQILLTCQDSQELAACFNTYQEARDRLRDKARSRGFWPIRGSQSKGKGRSGGGKKGKSFGGYGSMGSSMGQRRRSLAERIANSACRKCGQTGHWRRECPLNVDKDKEKTNFTGLAETLIEEVTKNEDTHDIVYDLPEHATLIDEPQQVGQTRDSHTGGVGTAAGTLRETCGKDLRGDLSAGSAIHDAAVEPSWRLNLGPKFPDVLPSSEKVRADGRLSQQTSGTSDPEDCGQVQEPAAIESSTQFHERVNSSGSPSPRSKGENKRPMPEIQNVGMKIEPNPDRVEVLRTQIAIMQRELQKELNAGEASGSVDKVHEDQ
eukprot:s1182_g22.t1